MIYDDRFPWPVGADALGAGERWLSPDKLGNRGLDEHRFLGRSLERLNVDQPGTLVANWAASPLDGATPGPGQQPHGQPAVGGGRRSRWPAAPPGRPASAPPTPPQVRVRFAGSAAGRRRRSNISSTTWIAATNRWPRWR